MPAIPGQNKYKGSTHIDDKVLEATQVLTFEQTNQLFDNEKRNDERNELTTKII